MFKSRILFFVLAVFAFSILTIQTGCDRKPDSTAVLKQRFEEMKAASKVFEDLLVAINDEASAKEAVPKLEKALEDMLATGKILEKAAETRARTAVTLKAESKDFRKSQGERVAAEVARLQGIEGVEAALEPILSRMGDKYKPISAQQ